MKCHLKQQVLGLLCAVCLTGQAFAQNKTGNPNPAQTPSTNAPSTNANAATQDTNAKATMHLRASKLIGMNIQNPEGKSVGEINDLVIDGDSGKVNYAAVTYGGFLGIGNKMFAVPFEAFEMRSVRNDSNERVLVLNVTQSQLEGSVGFDENNWPNFADETFVKDLDRRYNVRRNRAGGGLDINIDRRGIDVEVGKDKADSRRPGTTPRP